MKDLNEAFVHLNVGLPDDVERLKAAGCDYVQGYFFAKPMPLDQFEEHWKAQNYARVNPEEK